MKGDVINLFLTKIEKVCHKKEELFDNSKSRYAMRSIFAGVFLTMSTAGGAYAAEKISHIHSDLGKFMFSFLFAWGLIYILFLNAELATSNMMYLTAGVYHKYISFKKAIIILFYCLLFNLIGAMLIGYLFAHSSAFSHIKPDNFIVSSIVQTKVLRTPELIVLEGILANIFVNVAILAYLFIEKPGAKIAVVLSAIFLFVYLGEEHVVANFASFSIVKFNDIAQQLDYFTWFNIVKQWLFAFIGNYIGGGLVIGLAYAWLNKTNSEYID
ncbi:formate-nitrite transporter [Granulicatella sp. zg-ZJ]|uniref:formate/nitrite transporter family protein n=1 Tax=Granulicatella sp. zg-ZJ TaxID=2678504 RepID=UPI0013D7008F|nr:formate/nitrite transporter family protein [Granulicatella sp. zg-ZJ]NEW63374.1 formate-nitrite transporter [Granulicatella sp. zg-ZJ]